jgi:hypothetical protein
MYRIRRTLGAAALLTGLLAAPYAIADDPKAEEIASKMGGVVDSLGKKQTGTPVQGEQKEIIRELDELIASLEKQCEQCKNGIKRNNPNRGMDDSQIRSGTGGIGTLTNGDDSAKDWGKLSERERDRILQSQTEGFPPEYRTVLERYYRRLAEEKSAKTAGEGAKAKATTDEVKPKGGSAAPDKR